MLQADAESHDDLSQWLDSQHPDPRLTTNASFWTKANGTPIASIDDRFGADAVHWNVRRQMSYAEVIESEANPSIHLRPSIRKGFDHRTISEKLRDWMRLWMRKPTDACRLVWIDRHPPMVTNDYDDSDDWAAKRWVRALKR